MVFDINSIDMFQKKLDTLKKNDENLSQELIQTKYAKAYKKLQDEIKSLMKEAVFAAFVMTWDFLKKDEQEAIEILRAAYKVIEQKCFSKEHEEALTKMAFASYDANIVFNQAELYIDTMELDLYFPYWEKQCIKKDAYTWGYDKNTVCTIYNNINRAYWNPTKQLWVNHYEDGTPYWRGGGLSPIKEDNVMDFQKRKEFIEKKVFSYWEDYHIKTGKLVKLEEQQQIEGQMSLSQLLN